MPFLYEMIGRLVVWAVRRRYGRQLLVAGVFVLATALVGAAAAYLLASRDVQEG